MVKLGDTLKPMGNFPVAESSDVELTLTGGTKKSVQEAYEDGDLGGADSVQVVDTLPAPSVSLVGQVVVYVGETSVTAKKGHVYKCKAEGASYSWEDITAPEIVPNPAADATDDMVKLLINGVVYKWPRSASSGQKNVSAGKQLNCLYETKDLLIFGIDKVIDSNTWTDGTNLFYSDGNVQTKYNPSTKIWEKVTWNVSNLYAAGVWRDPVADETYYSFTGTHYKLNKTTYEWESVIWPSSIRSYMVGENIRALPFCFDGEHISVALLLITSSYYYMAWLNGGTPQFMQVYFSGLSVSYPRASYFWSDGVNKLYCNNYSTSYVGTITEGTSYIYMSSTTSLIQTGGYTWYDKDWSLHADWKESGTVGHKVWDTSTSTFVDVTWQEFPSLEGNSFNGYDTIKVVGSNYYLCAGYYFYELDLVNRVATKLISAGLAFVMGSYVWTDGIDIFASTGGALTKKFDSDTLTFTDVDNGLPADISGFNIWTDGDDIYAKLTYKWNKTTKRFESFAGFSGLTSLGGVWTDGTNVYSSLNANQYVLNKTTLEWTAKTWTGLTDFNGIYIWTDGTNIYHSYGTTHYVLNVSNSTWSTKTWTGLTDFNGDNVWTKDGKTYVTDSSYNQYVLDGSTWTLVPTKRTVPVLGSTIWTDGNNYYSGNAVGCCKLDFTNPSPTIHCKPVLTA